MNLVLVLLVAAQRLGEMVLSTRNRRRLRAEGVEAVADPVFPLMVLSHVILLLGSAVEPWWLDRPFVPWLGWPALALFSTAQALRVWVVRTLGKHWNVRILASSDRGVVSAGPYRWIRHPNYLVVLVETLTLPLVHSAWWTWIVVQVIHTPVLWARIRAEERYLLSRPEYVEAMGSKPRLVPRLRRSE